MNQKKIIGIAIGITFIQIILMLIVQIERTTNNPIYAYSKLFQWDSEHYQEIVENPYTEESAAFFPSYSIFSRVLSIIMPSKYAMIITAQIACVLFWFCFIILLRKWGIPIALPIALVIAHPASFFLVVAYSESVFCASIICFIYSTYTSKNLLAIISGITMGLTRIVGLPMSILPILLKKTRIASIGPILGVIIFFLFLFIRFGNWDQYLIAQQTGWSFKTDYLFFLHPPKWLFFPWAYTKNVIVDYTGSTIIVDPNANSRWITSITLYLSLLSTIVGKRVIAICAIGMFYICLAAMIDNALQSMMRYMLVIHVLIVLATAHRLKNIFWWILPIVSSPIMLIYAKKFIEGSWVA